METFSNILIYVWYGMLVVLPLLLGLISNALHFWSRGRIDTHLGLKYQSSLYFWLPKGSKPEYKNKGNCGDFWVSYILYNCITLGILGAGIIKLINEVESQTLLNSVFIISGIILVIYVPRFIIDLCRGLKFNKGTGDLEKINELQKQIDELKNK